MTFPHQKHSQAWAQQLTDIAQGRQPYICLDIALILADLNTYLTGTCFSMREGCL